MISLPQQPPPCSAPGLSITSAHSPSVPVTSARSVFCLPYHFLHGPTRTCKPVTPPPFTGILLASLGPPSFITVITPFPLLLSPLLDILIWPDPSRGYSGLSKFPPKLLTSLQEKAPADRVSFCGPQISRGFMVFLRCACDISLVHSLSPYRSS